MKMYQVKSCLKCTHFIYTVHLLLLVAILRSADGAGGVLPHVNKFSLNMGPQKNTTSGPCNPITAEELKRVLGNAYNKRYMATAAPAPLQDNRPGRGGGNVKSVEDSEGFAVDNSLEHPLGSEPAWVHNAENDEVSWERKVADVSQESFSNNRRRRLRRNFDPTPWSCSWRVRWIDLGPDYFPRFLRTVECEKRRCWYDTYECRGRSFAVKLLRRVPGACAPVPLPSEYSEGPPGKPTELWRWEERAVTFCCECAVIEPQSRFFQSDVQEEER